MASYGKIGAKLLCFDCMIVFPTGQAVSHATSTNHIRSLEDRYRTPPPDKFYCDVCKGFCRRGEEHATSKNHRKALRLLEEYNRGLEAGDGEVPRFSWSMESAHALRDHVKDHHGDVLLEPFLEAARDLSLASNESILSMIGVAEENGEMELLSLLLEIRQLVSPRPAMKKRILATYKSILDSTVDMRGSSLWLLKHNLSSASDLLDVLKEADDDVMEDGFWVVQDDRVSGSTTKRHCNLLRLLTRSASCKMKFETSSFGASLSAPVVVSYEEGVPFYMETFIVMSLALELAMDGVMRAFLGDDVVQDVFREALFYHVPSTHSILYDPDLDFDRHIDTAQLGFRSGESLVDGRASHLAVDCRDDFDEQVVEIYSFHDAKMEHIMKGDCKIAHNIPLVDDGFGVCVRAWVEDGARPSGGLLRVIHGVTRGAVIASTFGSRTSIHVEDSMLATFNLLVLGAPKIWYIVPRVHGLAFMRLLKRRRLLEASFGKRCFVQAFHTGDFGLSKNDMEKFDVRRVVQYPGMTVMTVPGAIFHWTVSTGFSLADSVNFYGKFRGCMDLEELQGLWNSYKAGAGNCSSSSSTTSSQYFSVCKGFKLF